MRRSIALLVTAGLVPIVVLSAAFGTIELHNQRVETQTRAQAHARLASMLITDHLRADLAFVQLISRSPAFDGSLNKARFTVYAARAMSVRPDWRAISLATPAGIRVLDVPAPVGGAAGGPVVDPESLKRAVATHRAVVGRALVGPRGTLAFAIRAPVIRGDAVPYVVSAVVPTASLRNALAFDQLPKGVRVGVVDGMGYVIASSDPISAGLGRLASKEAIQARANGLRGLYRFTRRDGSQAAAVFVPVAGTDWSVHVSSPIHAYTAPGEETLLLLVVATILCLALFAILARMLITDMRQAREREAADLQRQRMESLGVLTGGVAHDFNNLLTPIIGGLDLLRNWARDQPRPLRHVELAMASAERARILTGRLLAYARNQKLAPSDIDLRSLFAEFLDLINNAVAPSATVVVELSDALPPVRADKAQLELAILNLAVNARDAMTGTGVIRIHAGPVSAPATASLPPGRYVSIAIVDPGSGMDEATLQRAIEPFFTTKKEAKGTGLGLSMVHGFAAQSGGALHLHSKPGEGTVAEIVLPEGTERPGELHVARPTACSQGHSRLLLVDDEASVREATADLLRSGGHEVIEAPGVPEALELLRRGEPVDAIVTDYLMPRQTGADLVALVRTEFPEVPVLLITGYMDAAKEIPFDVKILAKPFRADELLRTLASLGVD